MKKRLCKSRSDRKICGVCGGIAEYFGIDSTLVRLVVAALTIFTSYIVGGVAIYLIAAFILPVANSSASYNEV